MKLKQLTPFVVIAAILGSLAYVIGVLWTASSLVILFLASAGLLIANQEKLLYMPVVAGYKRVSDNPEGYRSPADWGALHEDFYVSTSDGEKIHGWYIHRPSPVGTVIFCHENAGNIGFRANNLVAMSNKLNVDIVAFDYRGYGDSSGEPSEMGLIADTEAVYKYVVSELKAKNIFIYGRSLGGAVAIQYASILGSRGDTTLRGLIVENTFTSISDMIGAVFPFLNFSLIKKYLLRLKWESYKWVQFVACPVMFIVGLKDELVPPKHTYRLKEFCDKHNVKAELVTVSDGMHNDTWIAGGQSYWNQQSVFISSNCK